MEIAEHIAAVRRHGDSLAAAAEQAGLDSPVPPCTPWLVKDLLRHTGYVHRWAARHLTERPAEMIDGPGEDEILGGGAADGELVAWFRAGHAALVQALSEADPGLQTATFMAAPSPLAFWARRQAHETAIHRVDAESATGKTPRFPADFAADGVDELIMGFGRRPKYQPQADRADRADRAAWAGTLHVLAADTGDAWYAEAENGRIQPRRGRAGDDAASAACTVSGSASGLYLFMWNRADAAKADVTITGDPTLLALWQSSVRVRWS